MLSYISLKVYTNFGTLLYSIIAEALALMLGYYLRKVPMFWSSIFVTFTLKKIIDWNISFQTVSCIHLMNVDVYDCNSHIHNPACFHLTLDLFQNRFCRINSDLNVP